MPALDNCGLSWPATMLGVQAAPERGHGESQEGAPANRIVVDAFGEGDTSSRFPIKPRTLLHVCRPQRN